MDCRSSKRGRGNGRAETTTKKKTKGAVTKAEEAAEEGNNEWFLAAELDELWLRSWIGVDEGMPWATCWFPFWEVEAYDALYGDVVWDFDIWGLKAADNIAPNI